MVTEVAVRFIVTMELAGYFDQPPQIWLTNRTAILVAQNVFGITSMKRCHAMEMLFSLKWSESDVHVVCLYEVKLYHKDMPQVRF